MVTAVSADRAELLTGSDSLEAIAIHLGMPGEEFDVIDPPELAVAVRRLAERLHWGAVVAAEG